MLVADVDPVGAAAVAAEIGDLGGIAVAQPCDVGEPDQVQAMVEAAVRTFGSLHVLHNNAALTARGMQASDGNVVDLDIEVWERSMAVNARGPMLGCKYAVPHMLATGGGSIINTSSNAALAGDLGSTAYSAAKGAMVALTMSVATAFGKQGIRCNCISPSATRTKALLEACSPEVIEVIAQNNLLPRIGEPEDVANLAVFLASEESSFITGQVIRCDGGQLSHLPHFSYFSTTGRSKFS